MSSRMRSSSKVEAEQVVEKEEQEEQVLVDGR